jgi:hypothetical protein
MPHPTSFAFRGGWWRYEVSAYSGYETEAWVFAQLYWRDWTTLRHGTDDDKKRLCNKLRQLSTVLNKRLKARHVPLRVRHFSRPSADTPRPSADTPYAHMHKLRFVHVKGIAAMIGELRDGKHSRQVASKTRARGDHDGDDPADANTYRLLAETVRQIENAAQEIGSLAEFTYQLRASVRTGHIPGKAVRSILRIVADFQYRQLRWSLGKPHRNNNAVRKCVAFLLTAVPVGTRRLTKKLQNEWLEDGTIASYRRAWKICKQKHGMISKPTVLGGPFWTSRPAKTNSTQA